MMQDQEPIVVRLESEFVTDADRHRAMMMTMETGRPVVMHAAARRRWWQFWKWGRS